MPKKVLLVGHCGPDSSFLRLAVRSAAPQATLAWTNDNQEIDRLLDGVDLALVNRALDGDFPDADGIELIQRLHPRHTGVKFMLVSNYPEAQTAARSAGALPGFGKRDIGSPRAKNALKKALE